MEYFRLNFSCDDDICPPAKAEIKDFHSRGQIHEIGRMPIAYRGKDERVERVLMYYCTSSLLALVQDAAEEPSTYCFSVYPGNKT